MSTHLSREARITISGVELNYAQSMAVRVAVGSMMLQLQDPQHREDLGPIAAAYEARLSEVQSFISLEAR